MGVRELTTKDFLAHLYRHPLPEIISDECLSALSAIEAGYGDEITHGAGLEVRLGEEARYVDYIMNIDEDGIPGIDSLWYEIDYEEFLKASRTKEEITPCLFANTDAKRAGDSDYWEALLPPFLGEDRTKKLSSALYRVLEKLPRGAYIKQIGTMTGRKELSVMRLVIMFLAWEDIFTGLADIGWQGDITALRDALSPWKDAALTAVNIDLCEKGVLQKIGIELASGWRHPLLMDKFISRLESEGLCLASKGEALRRFIRMRPEASPFIQTLIAYFKLNYRDGRITEAKAYLEQSPYIHHHYFDAYDRPAFLELELKSKAHNLPVEEGLKWAGECIKNRVNRIRFTGDTAGYEDFETLQKGIAALVKKAGGNLITLTEIYGKVPKERLCKMAAAGAENFILCLEGTAEDEDILMHTGDAMDGLTQNSLRVEWKMHRGNVQMLPGLFDKAEKAGAGEFVITGMTPEGQFPAYDELRGAFDIIMSFRDENKDMELKVDPCFSPLRALMGGEDPKRNGNRGIERGCGAGRDRFFVSASGKAAPCRHLGPGKEAAGLSEYWENSPELKKLREKDSGRQPGCDTCTYRKRCLPCPAARETQTKCPVMKTQM